MFTKTKTLLTALAATTALAGAANATTLEITVTNNSGDNGVFFTPFLNVVHNGSYQAFTSGQAASPGIEELAEVGFTATAEAEARANSAANSLIGTLTEPTGVGDPAVGGPLAFDPGNSASFNVELTDDLQYLTLLSMIIPSNDTFVSATFDLFNDMGQLQLGDFTIGRNNVYDAGTEVNQSFGQAFNPSDGNGPGFLGDDENGVIHLSSDAELATLFDQQVPPFAGGFLTDANDVDFNNLITVSIREVAAVPLPAGLPLLAAGLGAFGFLSARRKKAA